MHIYGICSSTSYFCSETCFSTIRSWFNKICDNIPKFWYLAEPTNTSQTSVTPHSVGLHHIFRVKLRLKWCIQDQSHPSSPCMAGVGTTSLPAWPSSAGWCWSSGKGLGPPLAHHGRQSGAQGSPCPLQRLSGAMGQQGREGRPAPHAAPLSQTQLHLALKGCKSTAFSTDRQEQWKQSIWFHLSQSKICHKYARPLSS